MYRSHVYASSTKCTYNSHRRSYLNFCSLLGYYPIPASETTILQYIAYLARRLKPQCIPQYLNIVSLLHKEHGLPNPIKDNWKISSTMSGVNRLHGLSVHRKLPITKDILLGIHPLLNLHSGFDATFWAICLTLFFGLFRKSHILPTSIHTFDPLKQFIKSDFTFHSWGVAITVRWSKTVQFQERLVHVPLHTIPNSPLCPISAIFRFLHFIRVDSPYSPQSPMFTYIAHPGTRSIPITYHQFLSRLRSLLSSLGFNPSDYGSHSFRRGGASLAHSAGIPTEHIKALGDWHSDSVFLYLHTPWAFRMSAQRKLISHLTSHSHSH